MLKQLMLDYTGKPTIKKHEINLVVGVTVKEVITALVNTPYFGKRSHVYLIDEVADCLENYMHSNKYDQEKNKNLNDSLNIKQHIKRHDNEYWKIK